MTDNPLIEVIDEATNTFNKIYIPKVEIAFYPNADGSASLNGELAAHIERWHFRGGANYAKTPEKIHYHNFGPLLFRDWPLPDGRTINGVELLLVMEAMLTTLVIEGRQPAAGPSASPVEPPGEGV